jgi:hypothetical protein
MKLIAHRGLFNGPDSEKENHPDQIQAALDLGFECEVDVWLVDEQYFLGHDKPTYPVSRTYVENDKFWVHCKNVEALESLPGLNCFWHQNDDYTLTLNGYVWAYPGKPLSASSICVMPEWNSEPGIIPCGEYAGVCSDYVSLIKKNNNEGNV